MHSLSVAETAYLAALIDGEGTVTLSHIHAGQMRYLVVSVCNNERQIIEWVQTVTGVGHITGKRSYSVNHGENFTWRVASRRALNLLEIISPYMLGYKRRRAELALSEYIAVTPRNGRYTPELLEARQDFERRFFEITAQKKSPA
jgi:hypothetical protein